MDKTTYSRIILITVPQQTLFRNLANYQKCLLCLRNDKLVFDTLDEKFTFGIEEIKGVRFQKYNGSLLAYIDTTKGMFVGYQQYKEYKEDESKIIFDWLRSMFLNGKIYDKLIKSKARISFRMFCKQS